MARSRSIKPGFFTNEDLIELPFEYRLLFAGLWTMADRAGRLEDRPKKIKINIFPGDNVDCDAGLQALHDKGFITRYSIDGTRYIEIKKWSKHQSPHIKEVPSTIPAPCEHRAETSAAALTPSSLTPDSGLLTPDCGYREHVCPKISQSTEAEQHAAVQRIKAEYPTFAGRQNWIQVELHCKNRIDEGATWEQLESGTKRYAAFIAATGQHVISPVNFFSGADQPWAQPWEIPPPKPQPSKFTKPSPGEIVQHGDRERADLEKLMARRDAIGIGGFRDPLPKETASQYRLAQDAEWTRRKAASALPSIAASGGAT